MAKQSVNLGTAPTGTGGDTPRSAFTKFQANFDELYTALGNATTPAQVLAALQAVGGYGRSNILGTVSQSSGTPTGAIIERGSNSNGDYVKYADGTMICWKKVSTGNIPNANGAVFNSAAVYPGSFPAAFVSIATVVATATSAGQPGFLWVANYAEYTLTQWGGWCAISPYSTGNGSVLNFVAIGRWY